MTKRTLSNPFLEITFPSKPQHWKKIVVLWFLVSVISTFAFLYGYAVVLPKVIGFEQTILVGIGLIMVSMLNYE